MSAIALTVFCGACRKMLPVDPERSGTLLECPGCRGSYRVDLFPAVMRRNEASLPQGTTLETQATCFYHENYQAKVACESCGRFLCGLCDVPFLGGHHCVRCIENMQHEKKPVLVNSEFRYLNVATMLLLVSIPFWFLSFLTLPAALIMVIKHFRRKNPVLPTSIYEVGTFVAAALIGIALVSLIVLALVS